METLINLVIQLIAGVVGGNAAGAALKDYNLGNIGNTIAGARRRRRRSAFASSHPGGRKRGGWR
jgi:hypothetical protein